MSIQQNKVVSFHYTLSNANGNTIESSRGRDPMVYLHGAGNIIPGLEKEMAGKSAGDTFNVTVEPAEAYGERSQDKLQRVSAKAFSNAKKLRPGQVIRLQTRKGPIQATVVKVGRFNIDIDANHPLAGQALTFDVEITDVRDATEEEIAHRHVHGPGGVNH
jgi:FKBP-type peptidyl-prolyl cis-trans isomerase SlyD